MSTGLLDEREQRLESALAACLQAAESGTAADLCAALAGHAEFAAEVADFFSARGRVEKVAAPLRLLTPDFTICSDQTTTYLEGRGIAIPHGEHPDFPDYELREVLGSGGMGVVYRAFQRSLGVFVALKVILAGRLASPEEVTRFREEAKKVAQLKHPHIVRVLHCAEHHGRHYLTMDLMEGGSLSRQIALGPIPSRLAAKWLLEVARAIQAVHQIGMLHRDLKPANIVLDKKGMAYVTDFGLAKWIDQEGSKTAPGAIVGTLGYMPPEHTGVGSTVASDIYGLGATLYAMLTGRPPFHSETVFGTLEQVRYQEPIAPHLLNPEADPDLELVCLKCLEKEPGRRYASAVALVEDLEAIRAGEPLPNTRRPGLMAFLFRPFEYRFQDKLLRSWSRSNLMSAAVGLLGHGTVFLLIRAGQPVEWALLVLGCLWVLMALNVWANLIRNARSAHRTEGHVLASYLGYVLAYPVLFASPGTSRDAELLAIYPALALLTGLVVFFHGSLYWGRQYLVGLGYYALAFLMRLWPAWAPLEFAIYHASYLIFMSQHLRRQR